MPQVVGVQFQPVTKIYHFDPRQFTDLLPGEWVVVDTARGYEIVQVVVPPKEIDEDEINGQLKPVIRRATSRDLSQKAYWSSQEEVALNVCKRKAREHNLSMKVVRCTYSFNGRQLLVEFLSDKRIDFRALVKDLAHHFSTRIEMRQIGVRDQAKQIGGFGKCGRMLCCSAFLREFHSVSIRMAKNQNLPLNPTDISGSCGRLLCSLAYEDDLYTEMRKRLPKRGQRVETAEGMGRVLHLNILLEKAIVELDGGSRVELAAADLNIPGQAEGHFGSKR
ncbi:MAG: stage 0 sporulation family protein [Chloroflexi bacterium]|nr:stage 0 sporulation family protein [Chloroflexota bacterium]